MLANANFDMAQVTHLLYTQIENFLSPIIAEFLKYEYSHSLLAKENAILASFLRENPTKLPR